MKINFQPALFHTLEHWALGSNSRTKYFSIALNEYILKKTKAINYKENPGD